MNLVAKQIYGNKKNLGWNTYIGGVSAYLGTPALLATKLGISIVNITNFVVEGSDIKCRITANYSIPSNCFNSDINITYYKDIDGKCTSILAYGFGVGGGGAVFKEAYFPNVTFVASEGFSCGPGTTPNMDYIYIPRCTVLGASPSTDSAVFGGAYRSFISKLYVDVSLQTVNAGSPDPDLTTYPSLTGNVVYVTNFTPPNAVSNLTSGTIYNTAVQLNFTPPSSTNAIDFYEVYVNGVFKNKVTASGQYTTGLTASTNYNITIYAVDIFYNKSLVSNVLNVSTNTTSVIDNSKVIAAYHLQTNGVDSKNAYDGTVGSGVSFSGGAVFDGTSNANISIADNDVFSFGDGTNDYPFTFSFYMQFANKSTVGTPGYIPLSKSNNRNNINDEYYLVIYNSFIYWILADDNTIGSHIGFQYDMASLLNNNYYHFAITYDGSKLWTGIKFYINGVLATVSSFNSGTYTGMNNGTFPFKIGNDNSNSYGLNGKMQELNVFNAELTQQEVTFLQTSNYPF